MAAAFVLIGTDMGSEKDVAQRLKGIEGVSEVHIAYGAYDIIAKVEAETREKVKDIVFSKIRMLDEVRSTLTLVVAE